MAINRAQYLDAAIKLLPVGLAWSRALDSNIAKLLDVRAEQLEDVNRTAHQLIKERMPGKSVLLLEEWEEYFGLPESGRQIVGKTIVERQVQVEAKENELGSNSRGYLTELATRIGVNIELENIFPHHCVRNCMYPLYEYSNWWRVWVHADKTLDDTTKTELEAMFKRYAYADLEFIFKYDKDTK